MSPIVHGVLDGDERRTISKSRAAPAANTSDVPEDVIVQVPASGSFETDANPARTTMAADAAGAERVMASRKTNADKTRWRIRQIIPDYYASPARSVSM